MNGLFYPTGNVPVGAFPSFFIRFWRCTMINLIELQWITRCLSHSCEDSAVMAEKVMDMFSLYPALIDRYYYLYVMARKQLAQ